MADHEDNSTVFDNPEEAEIDTLSAVQHASMRQTSSSPLSDTRIDDIPDDSQMTGATAVHFPVNVDGFYLQMISRINKPRLSTRIISTNR